MQYCGTDYSSDLWGKMHYSCLYTPGLIFIFFLKDFRYFARGKIPEILLITDTYYQKFKLVLVFQVISYLITLMPDTPKVLNCLLITWCYDMDTLSAPLDHCTGGFPAQRDSNAELWWFICCYCRLEKFLNKQPGVCWNAHVTSPEWNRSTPLGVTVKPLV